jgi:hypothetical protein
MANNHQFKFVTANGADELFERNIYQELNRHHESMGRPVGNDFDEVAPRIMQHTANALGVHYAPSSTDTHVVHTFTHPTAHAMLAGQPTAKEAYGSRMEGPDRKVTGSGYSSVDPSKTDEMDIVRPFNP